MTETSQDAPIIRAAKGRSALQSHLLGDHTLVIMQDEHPLVRIRPGFNSMIGPHVTMYRVLGSGEEVHLVTFNVTQTRGILRWLPLVLNAARRLGSIKQKKVISR